MVQKFDRNKFNEVKSQVCLVLCMVLFPMKNGEYLTQSLYPPMDMIKDKAIKLLDTDLQLITTWYFLVQGGNDNDSEKL